MRTPIALAIAAACLTAPAFAQTTTTVQSQPQAAPPPPTTTTTTVQTQPAPPATPAPSTQVVVTPSDSTPPPPPPARVRVAADRDVTTVETRNNPPPLQIVAVDALYGGLIGTVIGGGVTLIESGNNWQRDLAVGAGVGVLAGAAFGVYDASSRSSLATRAAADPAPGVSNTGHALASLGGNF